MNLSTVNEDILFDPGQQGAIASRQDYQ